MTNNIIETSFGQYDKFLVNKVQYPESILLNFLEKCATSVSGIFFVIYDKKKEFVQTNYFAKGEDTVNLMDKLGRNDLIQEVSRLSNIMSNMVSKRTDGLSDLLGLKRDSVEKRLKKNVTKSSGELNSSFNSLLKMERNIVNSRSKNEESITLKQQKVQDLLQYKNFLVQSIQLGKNLVTADNFPIGINDNEQVLSELSLYLIDLEKEIGLSFTEMKLSTNIVQNSSIVLKAISNAIIEFKSFFTILDKVSDHIQWSNLNLDDEYLKELFDQNERQKTESEKLLNLLNNK